MSFHASTTQEKQEQAVFAGQRPDADAAGTPPQAPPQRPASRQPMSPFAPDFSDAAPLFRGALGAKESPVRMRHLVGLCAWAAAVTLLGIAVGLWVMIRLMSYGTPEWYEPVIVLTGLAGVGLEIAAFVNVDKGTLPWALMGGSTFVLFVSIGITAAVG
ncbi:MAG TPA: hypothetical protein VFZ32_10075 [Micromonosporaceae bacterium]